ncbi:uncharacterized protein MELLADRAFT_102587 [Melampsora larici-populina 98AG31]|uniref:rRNA biogenesis protein RRP36 n=1 Tax=Melampsora larici-populina (strain 98AG31 / pathotype 3-4-7) TaxID=747676 RepID=F4R796_MELLP|nr:uncharacterized protein MELLADRAFT_102587 [Melampsora larici-populina 98AG31]EGG11551.1 hypothetical protein MELLADRAFT_102587 [Melampsora larici-populina 98AG31]
MLIFDIDAFTTVRRNQIIQLIDLSIGALLKSQKQAKTSTQPETKPSKPKPKVIEKVEQSSESESEPKPKPELGPSSSYPRIQQRTNKHAPMAMSSKRSVTRRRTVVAIEREREREVLKKWKTEEKAKQQDGENPFYLKKKEHKEVILADRFNHFSQDKRKLQKAVERKRKKVAGKEKKSMPAERARS